MIIVTGGAGFIGANIIEGLNQQGITDILVVDELINGHQFKNLVDLSIADYWDIDTFYTAAKAGQLPKISAIFHQGACSDTTEWDGKFMMARNFECSKILLHYALEHHIPFLYASSAAVYGKNTHPSEHPDFEQPLNVYGYSKLLFDQYVRQYLHTASSPICGFRYFNVYGPREQHKGKMASVAWHHYQQLLDGAESVKLFEGSGGFGPGEQRRDFVYVKDVVSVNLWAWQNQIRGIYNVGTGQNAPFNAVAKSVIGWTGRGKIEYIPFPEKLLKAYQHETQAEMAALRDAGYDQPFHTVEAGIQDYLTRVQRRESTPTAKQPATESIES